MHYIPHLRISPATASFSSLRCFNTHSFSCSKPSTVYNARKKSKNLIPDANQLGIVHQYLDKLHSRLNDYTLPTKDQGEVLHIPRGLYLYGGVGTGKSMLLNLFYQGVNVKHKKRVHFHTFMLDIQIRLDQEKRKQLERYGRQRHISLERNQDVIGQVAHAIADESHLLCFDEFQVTDVANALIMRKLFHVLFTRGVVMVATSNTPPQDLYRDGTNREYFLPFLDQLAKHTRVVSMDSDVDYRYLCERMNGTETFLSPLSNATKIKMDKLYQDLLVADDRDFARSNGRVQDKLLRVPVMMGRTLDVRGHVKSGVCRTSFRFLCHSEKGVADYKAMAECFHTLVLDDVPILGMAQHDQARRFIVLVDELYEHRTRLVISSEAAEPRGIFLFDDETVWAASKGTNSLSVIEEEKQRMNKENATLGVPSTSSWDSPIGAYGPSQMTAWDVGDLVALTDLKVAFKRAVSRLREMQGTRYICENICWRHERIRRLESVVQIIKE